MPRTAPVSLAASMRSADAVPVEPVGVVVGVVAVAGDDRERSLALRAPSASAVGSRQSCRARRRIARPSGASTVVKPVPARRLRRPAAVGAAGSIWVGGLGADAERVADDDAEADAQREQHDDGDDSEDRPAASPFVMGSR